MNPHRKTFSAKPAEAQAQRGWWVVDAANVPLGRLASVVAQILRGKNKPTFTPHVDVGDFVVVVNADKVKLTGHKWTQKHYYHHSGFPGGLRKIRYDDLVKKKPEMPVHEAVRGMLPKSNLGRQLIKKLKIYAGPEHPHTAQTPQVLEMTL